MIVGPTGVGKTAVAMALARLWPITVISADARQIYRTLDIGTAKPTPEERRLTPHLGIDLLDLAHPVGMHENSIRLIGVVVSRRATHRPIFRQILTRRENLFHDDVGRRFRLSLIRR